jgi:TRAP-type C4-dicarboxylate transport system permease small subunit
MVYLKSVFVGILSVVATGVILYTTFTLLLIIPVMLRGNEGFDLPRWHVHFASPVFWVLVLGIFAAGFWWEFRRISH